MHVVSDDFISGFLKKSVHWNSFNTRFFLSLPAVIKELSDSGFINVNVSESNDLLKSPLKCRFCNETFCSVPKLKKHLSLEAISNK